jgi:hypothetical protein
MKFLQGKAPCNVLGMRIQSTVLVNDENSGEFRRRLAARIGAERPDEIAPDVPIPIRRRNGFIARLDAVAVLVNLLPQGVIRHQCLDNGCSSKTADGETLHPIEKVTTTDLAVNEARVQVHRFSGNFLRLSHTSLCTLKVTNQACP